MSELDTSRAVFVLFDVHMDSVLRQQIFYQLRPFYKAYSASIEIIFIIGIIFPRTEEDTKMIVCRIVIEIDDVIARRKPAAWDIEIDKLTAEQEEYLNSWQF